jgi:hypothetical protein
MSLSCGQRTLSHPETVIPGSMALQAIVAEAPARVEPPEQRPGVR